MSISSFPVFVKDQPNRMQGTMKIAIPMAGAIFRAFRRCGGVSGFRGGLPGIKSADRDEFFSFTKGRILTIDS
jgi:hypothetical protein